MMKIFDKKEQVREEEIELLKKNGELQEQINTLTIHNLLLKKRIDKAIEHIKEESYLEEGYMDEVVQIEDLLKILKGEK